MCAVGWALPQRSFSVTFSMLLIFFPGHTADCDMQDIICLPRRACFKLYFLPWTAKRGFTVWRADHYTARRLSVITNGNIMYPLVSLLLLPSPASRASAWHSHPVFLPPSFHSPWQEQKGVLVVSVAAHCTSLPHPSTRAGNTSTTSWQRGFVHAAGETKAIAAWIFFWKKYSILLKKGWCDSCEKWN